MAFPYSWESGFEEASVGASKIFQTETDTANKLSIAHYTDLARHRLMTHSGAYALMVDNPVGDATDAFVSRSSSLDMAPGVTRFIRWYLWLGENFAMGSGDGMVMMNIIAPSGAGTIAAAVGLRAKADNRIYAWVARNNSGPDHLQEMAIGTNEPPYTDDVPETELGGRKSALMKWYHFELRVVFDNANNTGTLTLWVNDTQVGNPITGLQMGTANEVMFGYRQFQGAPIGEYVIDDIKVDNARIFMDRPDIEQITNKHITKAEDHPLVGYGSFTIALTGVGTDAVLELYDTDGVPDSLVPIDIIRNTAVNERVDVSRHYNVNFGLYTILSGTSAQAFVDIKTGIYYTRDGLMARGLRQRRPLP